VRFFAGEVPESDAGFVRGTQSASGSACAPRAGRPECGGGGSVSLGMRGDARTLGTVDANRLARGVRAALAGCLWACLATACGDDPAPRGPPRAAGVPGVVLVCLDTLRADGLADMPALAEFARGATHFVDASSSSAWTAPSVATLLTGLEPAHTGVRGMLPGAMVPGVSTVAETLSAAGWHTAAVAAGGWVAPERGMAQGFGSFQVNHDLQTPEAVISSFAGARPKDRPFFLFLHSYLPHEPYGPKDASAHLVKVPRPLVERAAADAKEAESQGGRLSVPAALRFLEVFLSDGPTRFAIVAELGEERADAFWRQVVERAEGDLAGTPGLLEVAARARTAYRGGLAHTDRLFARLLAAGGDALPSGTVWIVVGDHGEEFGEHGGVLHARRLYDELVRVPLVVSAPGRLPAGIVPGSCGLVDVAPTILELAGVSPADPLDGTSLLASAARGRPVPAEEERRVPLPDGGERRLRAYSVRTQAAKYVVTFDLKTSEVVAEELFDLQADPAETRSLPLDGLARLGDPFCRAVARTRALIPGFAPAGPCAK
jgi:arylsulfatase A-like enzyme